MGNEKYLAILSKGVKAWNKWRKENPNIKPDLSNLQLMGIDYRKKKPLHKGYVTDLRNIDFSGTDLSRVFAEDVDLSGADLSGSSLGKANFRRARLVEVDLSGADLYEVDLYLANLENATLRNARLTRARLVDANIKGATFENCNISGVAAWNLDVDEKTIQSKLQINDPANTWEPPLYVEDIEIAPLIFLLSNHRKLRKVLNVMLDKGVLILGRFRDGGLETLQAIASHLRHNYGYLPIIFDFDQPQNQDLIETVVTLAGLSRFIIADLSGPSVPVELSYILPQKTIPVVTIIEKGRNIPKMVLTLLTKYRKLGVVEPIYKFVNDVDLLKNIPEKIVGPAESKLKELHSDT